MCRLPVHSSGTRQGFLPITVVVGGFTGLLKYFVRQEGMSKSDL